MKDPKKRELLDGPHVYVSRTLQKLVAETLFFRICKEMFLCITDPEKQKIVISVTYGVGVPNEYEEECPDCETCDPAK